MTAPRDLAKPHHRAKGFQNNYLEFEPKTLAEVLRWRFGAYRGRLPPPPAAPIPTRPADLRLIHANATAARQMQPAVTWIGHSTVLAQCGSLNLLTDPIFSQRASPLGFVGPRRHNAPGLTLDQLPHIDLVLVSHDHYDHLDQASVATLSRQAGGSPLFVVPLGLRAWFVERGMPHVVELDWWQSHRMPGACGEVEVMLVPAQHWSGRGLADRMRTLWGGFAVFAPDCHLFFAGDTGYSRDFRDMRERFSLRQASGLGGGFDIALLPLGAYEPRWFMAPQHVNVEEAVKIHLDLGAKRSLGIHWGTFELTDEALDAPPRALPAERQRQGVADDDFFVIAIGETRLLPPRQGSSC